MCQGIKNCCPSSWTHHNQDHLLHWSISSCFCWPSSFSFFSLFSIWTEVVPSDTIRRHYRRSISFLGRFPYDLSPSWSFLGADSMADNTGCIGSVFGKIGGLTHCLPRLIRSSSGLKLHCGLSWARVKSREILVSSWCKDPCNFGSWSPRGGLLWHVTETFVAWATGNYWTCYQTVYKLHMSLMNATASESVIFLRIRKYLVSS